MSRLIALLARVTLAVITVTAGPATSRASDTGREQVPSHVDAANVASAWLEALIGGKAHDALALSSLPFAWDGRDEVFSEHELARRYAEAVERLGQWDLPTPTAPVPSDSERAWRVCGHHAAYAIHIGDALIEVCVSRALTPRVVGFSD